MILIQPSSEILSMSTNLDLMEKAGRTCYKSEPQGNPEAFIKKRLKEGHETIIEHSSMTVKFIVDRGFTHELVRHRLVTYSQESTRWCNYNSGVTFIIPSWITSLLEGEYNTIQGLSLAAPDRLWFISMLNAEDYYKMLLRHKWTPQQARSVLPNSLKTEIIATTNLRQWRLIFKQRALGTTGRPHPQMLQIMIPLLLAVKVRIPVIFDDLVEELTNA
jgi:thymidylate synthase (FAD)